MADNKKLDSIVQIDGENYEVIAEEAKKVQGTLTIKTIKDGTESTTTFNGSSNKEISIEVGDAESAKNAEKIQVNLDNNRTAYATITISKNDPTAAEGSTGNIWFKYN
jgi:hypothetical protein